MLFRGPHDGNDVGAVGARTGSEHSGDEDETCSTSGRSYTSAESATAQSFELRMAQLDGGNSSGTFQTDNGSNANTRNLLSPGYQLFSTAANKCGELNGEDKLADGPHTLTFVSGTGAGARPAAPTRESTRANDYSDEDERDDDYLTALLSDIERHAARLDTQFFRYPSAESLKQQMAAPAESRAKSNPASASKSANSTAAAATEETAKAEEAKESSDATAAEATPPAATAPTATPTPTPAAPTPAAGGGGGASGGSHSTGTKLFLGGLRYEVIQSGRHTVSWIFQVACGVHVNPTSILIHRKTKNGRSNVAPTGCASVFVADDKDVVTLLEMNQRIYCAEEGVYVSPTPEVMKELIASKDIVDVTGGRVRGPTHPVVIERAYSVSHHHGHHGTASNASTNTTATTTATATTTTTTATTHKTTTTGRGHGHAGAGASAANNNTSGGGGGGGGNNAHRHPRSPSTISAESNLSNQLMGGMPPPYGGAMPPQYSSTSNVSTVSGAYHPPSYAPSSVSSSSLTGPPMGVQMLATGQGGYPPGAMMVSRQSSPSLSQNMDDGRGSNTGGPLRLDPQRVTFHAYLRGAGKSAEHAAMVQQRGNVSGTHTVLFLAALPGDTTEDYVSWLFSLMSICLPAVRIHIIGGGASAADCCATVSVSEGDVSIALNYHHRVLCTSRGAWIGHSAHDIAALRVSDASLRDAAVLHVDRRMSAQVMSGGSVVGTPGTGGMGGGPGGYAHPMTMAGGGGPGGMHVGRGGGSGGPSLPPPPTSYPPLFGAMQLPGGPGAMLPMAGPWAYAPQQQQPGRPGMSGDATAALYANLPPPPGGMVPGLPPGAVPISAMLPPGSAYSMPPPPPPFSFTQSVTIGDRTYQLPPGATVQYMPMMAPGQAMGAPGDTMGAAKTKSGSSRGSTGAAGGYDSAEGSTAGHHGSPPPHGGPQLPR